MDKILSNFKTLNINNFINLKTQFVKENSIDLNFQTWQEINPKINPILTNSPYQVYLKELFFHIPWLIANHFNANQKFAEAQKWYHYLFNPSALKDEFVDDDRPTDRNWQFIGFRNQDIPKLSELLTNPDAIEKYKRDPFNPFAIARFRTIAFQKAIVMKYIDNLLDWGDYLFAQDSIESINEAMMLYTMAQDILGAKPIQLGKCEEPPIKMTYAEISKLLKPNTNRENHEILPIVLLENFVLSFGLSMFGGRTYISTITQELPLFCIPPNKDFLKYWDRVEDRLWKIRNCRNLEGVRRTLALFQPPIDPMMLVRARAAGLSISDILAALNAPIPAYRFTYLIEKARSFVALVQSLGGALLSALEKKDVEELNLLRSAHEQNILTLTKEIKTKQIKETEEQIKISEDNKKNIEERVKHYQKLIDGGKNKNEQGQIDSLITALVFQYGGVVGNFAAAITYLIPGLIAGLAPGTETGGIYLGSSISAFASATSGLASAASTHGQLHGTKAGFTRREQDWTFQKDSANREIAPIEKQIIAANIRKEIAEKDLDIHTQNITQSEELETFYKDKFSNIKLYEWMAKKVQKLYQTAYNLALQMAQQAEKTYQFERNDNTLFIQSNNWLADKQGLLAGEQLQLQLNQLEKAYIENNKREYEVTQPFSLGQIAPNKLLKLRKEGSCEFVIPEAWFDVTYPGQYKRRIKSVRLSIPCVTGPYVNVSCKLTLNNSLIRLEPSVDADLVSIPKSLTQSIATSTAQNDSGTFELNFRDERYLPFEGAGAVNSHWSLELPSKFRQFDYNTISDVIITLSYTALDDGRFKQQVEDNLQQSLNKMLTAIEVNDIPLQNHFSLKQHFPNALYQLKQKDETEQKGTTKIVIEERHFPHFVKGKIKEISKVSIIGTNLNDEELGSLDLTVNGKVYNDSNPNDFDEKLEIGISTSETENLKDVAILLSYKLST